MGTEWWLTNIYWLSKWIAHQNESIAFLLKILHKLKNIFHNDYTSKSGKYFTISSWLKFNVIFLIFVEVMRSPQTLQLSLCLKELNSNMFLSDDILVIFSSPVQLDKSQLPGFPKYEIFNIIIEC